MNKWVFGYTIHEMRIIIGRMNEKRANSWNITWKLNKLVEIPLDDAHLPKPAQQCYINPFIRKLHFNNKITTICVICLQVIEKCRKVNKSIQFITHIENCCENSSEKVWIPVSLAFIVANEHQTLRRVYNASEVLCYLIFHPTKLRKTWLICVFNNLKAEFWEWAIILNYL